MEPGEIGARSGIYGTLHRTTRTRHQEPNATNARRSCQGVFHRGIHHTQIRRTATPEQWEALTFTPYGESVLQPSSSSDWLSLARGSGPAEAFIPQSPHQAAGGASRP